MQKYFTVIHWLCLCCFLGTTIGLAEVQHDEVPARIYILAQIVTSDGKISSKGGGVKNTQGTQSEPKFCFYAGGRYSDGAVVKSCEYISPSTGNCVSHICKKCVNGSWKELCH